MKKTALVTAIGTVTATAVVRELKKSGDFHIIGADINRQYEIATSLDTDEYYVFPLAVEPSYIDFAVDFCKNHKVDYYFAVIDKEVVKIAENRAKFEEVGTKLCVVNSEFADACHYKDRFGEWIRQNLPEVAIREYRSLEEAQAAEYPLFIKPSEGVASSGCRKIESYKELEASVKGQELGSKYVLQDFVEGTNITVDCLRNRKTGQKLQIQRRELLRNSNGCGIAVEIFHDAGLETICNTLMEKLDLNGVVNMEFFETGAGYRIIEINPRFSAGTLYSCMSGGNTVLNAIHIAEGEPCEFGEIAVGAHFAERYEPYRMD
ncbi:ATP-grasp domain-containing protein [Butyrivibrio sp. MC2021]|uniref:ATP-grasp domain-containing protein n=1 Tax=Butyrivibrio sp. MC2021 TaxID=1408306 RepID=UPI00047D9C5E|nr:ATP-grasp domain-containing protein [Butyrivibrio sp. MC2021]